MRKERTQIRKIRNEKETKVIQGNIRDYLENPYSNELEYLKETEKFLDTYDHQKLNQEDINHLNRSITQNELKQQ
jgi:glutamate mutase epsilon subunit